MDTSPEYINMCRKAKELQETWEPKEGDWIFIQRAGDSRGYEKAIGGFNLNSGYYFYGGGDSVAIRAATDDVVWLPRLDQLIELVREHYINISTIQQSTIRVLCSLFDCENNISLLHSTQTPEQYILSELYREKYSKTLDGEDWI